MDEDRYWEAVQTMRLRIADLLEGLDPTEWDAPSLCHGWRVRDVVGHLACVPTITDWDMISAAPRARFDPNRINTLLAIRHGSQRPEELLAQLRAHAGGRRTAKALDTRNALFDLIVHSQDIAIPLDRDFPVAPVYSREGLQRVWSMGWPFRAKRKFAGLTLHASDTDWTVGSGPEVTGPALTLLLLLTGRTAIAVPFLAGPGVPAVRA
jgi:uncharacterized protein (TIGR03083 family)